MSDRSEIAKEFWAKEMAIQADLEAILTKSFLENEKQREVSQVVYKEKCPYVIYPPLETSYEPDTSCTQGVETFHRLMTTRCSWKFYACIGLLIFCLSGVAACAKYDLLMLSSEPSLGITSFPEPDQTQTSSSPTALSIPFEIDFSFGQQQRENIKPLPLKPTSGLRPPRILARNPVQCESVVIDARRRKRASPCSSRLSETNNLAVQDFETETLLYSILKEFPHLKALEIDYSYVNCNSSSNKVEGAANQDSGSDRHIYSYLNEPVFELQQLNKLTIRNNRNCLHLSPVLTFKAPKLHILHFDNIQLNRDAYTQVVNFIKPACSPANSELLNIDVTNSSVCSTCLFSFLDSDCPNLGNRSFLSTEAFEDPGS